MEIYKDRQTLLRVSFPYEIGNIAASNIYYTILNNDATTFLSRRNTNVIDFEDGNFGLLYTFSVEADYLIKWDVDGTVYYAAEELLVIDKTPFSSAMSDQLQFMYDVEGGRWKVNSGQLFLYKADNTTLIATFDLTDDGTDVVERQRV